MTADASSRLQDLTTPQKPGEKLALGAVRGCASSLLLSHVQERHPGVVIAITDDVQQAQRLQQEMHFFSDGACRILTLPDWETLPYDIFSPLPELVSQRLSVLHQLPQLKTGVLIVPVTTLMQRLAPPSYVRQHTLMLEKGQQLDLETMRQGLEQSGYRCVSQVFEHGEFAVRGSLLDLYPMGSQHPFRIDLFDDEIDSIRTFDTETQRTIDKIDAIQMLPGREFPTDEAAIRGFRQRYRQTFDQDPNSSLIYTEISNGVIPGGIEYYLPLFFDATATLFDYLPEQTLAIYETDLAEQAEQFAESIGKRFEQRRHDTERPLLPPERLYLDADELRSALKPLPGIAYQATQLHQRRKGFAAFDNLCSKSLPPLGFNARAERPSGLLEDFLSAFSGRVLFTAESAGRREHLLESLAGFRLRPRIVSGWQNFMQQSETRCLGVAPMEAGVVIDGIAIIPETALLGERVKQPRRRKRKSDADQIVRNLTELHAGAPVVHEEHGVGRFIGLQTIAVGDDSQEFLALEYAGSDKLYVPVSSLDLISRYSGASPEHAPLHKLGSGQWEKARRKAAKRAFDVAAELLEIYARREAAQGFAFAAAGDDYNAFANAFEFEETDDQANAIDAVLADMQSPRPMDRVVCGDVGFGKTEVAMRATFQAVIQGKQVAILVPTTLLAQQHFTNFEDRFADWPVRVAGLSRFQTAKEQTAILKGISDGSVDIVVGTQALLRPSIRFHNLGLVIIDEEHRFGVRHKERLKSLRSEVDMLTLTATPIPRTLNMAMSGLRDLSIIATPPSARHPIKTFISQWSDATVQEAISRETSRGGQVYLLHNEVSTIDNMAQRIQMLLPDHRIDVAHGQMRERDLERVMRDFYHQRFQVLVCTTIIESGIDVPTANTIIINRADKLGLAQLHQLRGRVGRSHHRAYAYLITPSPKAMTADARKRLEAIEGLEDLGAGFTLATHDLEIRGAGELLGDEQSGQINEVGYALYSDLLERAVRAIRAGEQPQLDRPLAHGAEVDLGIPALIPSDYLPDVHTRLVLYKRIAGAEDATALRELQVEMIDRFGLLPEALKNLFAATRIKLRIQRMGVAKLDVGGASGYLQFGEKPDIDFAAIIKLIQTRPDEYRLDGQEKLRFYGDFEQPETRIAKVENVLARVAGK
ncbi:MAG: transcription-repair coupling factor [Pseudomonadota bacterium]